MKCPQCNQQRLFLTKSAGNQLTCRYCGSVKKYSPPSYDSYHDLKYSYKRLRTINNDPLLAKVNNCFSDLNSNSKLLDYGCGAGDYAIHFRNRTENVVGLDRNVTQAKKNSQKIDWVSHTDTDLPFSNNHFDYITCVNVIEHMYDFAKTMRELKRILKPGGSLFITTYDTNFVLHKILFDETHLYEWNALEFTEFVSHYLNVTEAFKYGSFFNYYPLNKFLVQILKPELCVLAQKR